MAAITDVQGGLLQQHVDAVLQGMGETGSLQTLCKLGHDQFLQVASKTIAKAGKGMM